MASARAEQRCAFLATQGSIVVAKRHVVCCIVTQASSTTGGILRYLVTMRTLLGLLSISMSATSFAENENMLKNSGFELPVVQARTVEPSGANPAQVDEDATSWAHFQAVHNPRDKTGGKIAVGLTNEIARTGKQSVFVDFQNVTATRRRSFLMTGLTPVKAGETYRIGIWGRIDEKRPLTLDQRRPYLRVEVEYFTADKENQAGSADNRNEFIPGGLDRLFFVSTKWTEYFTTVRTPADAGFMKASFRWETGKEQGATDGLIYFDDASLQAIAVDRESLLPLVPANNNPVPTDSEKSDEAADKP